MRQRMSGLTQKRNLAQEISEIVIFSFLFFLSCSHPPITSR